MIQKTNLQSKIAVCNTNPLGRKYFQNQMHQQMHHVSILVEDPWLVCTEGVALLGTSRESGWFCLSLILLSPCY